MSFSMTGRPQPGAIAMGAPRMARRIRRPQHTFFLHFRPWEITPFIAAPVVPGETMKSALMQARVLSSPILNQVCGWWLETYFFYVKHRHLQNAATYTGMMLDMSVVPAAQGAAATTLHMGVGDALWVREAYRVVVNEFFRGDGEAVPDGTTLHKARVRLPGWWDSILPNSALDVGTDIGDDSLGSGFPALDQVGEVGKALEMWQTQRMLGVTNLEYDDWLRAFGVSIAAPMDDRPELIRYTREWQYPATSVSVDATAQRVSSVVSWSLTERIDKDRYFREPGLILGCVLARPKLYHSRRTSGIGGLRNALGWLTPLHSYSGYEHYQPVPNLAGFSFDPRDLYNHGDQWVYSAAGTPNIPSIAFPADGALDFTTTAEDNALFVDGANGHIKMDGVCNFAVASASVGPDITPRTV